MSSVVKHPLTLLSVTCLDAPLVAVSWQWLFAHTLGTPLSNSTRLVLFVTAWLIYLADRVADSFTVPLHTAPSLRQRFCREHRPAMIGLMMLLIPANIVCAWFALDARTLFFGGGIAALIIWYLAINHLTPFLWKRFPLKEVSIGVLFALGTVSAIHLAKLAFAGATFLFAMLCSLNCLSISVWERALDQSQNRVTFGTAFPRLRRMPEMTSWLLALTALCFTLSSSVQIFAICIAASAAALGILNHADSIEPDERVALADLVLLTPLFFLSCSGGL